MTVATIFTLFYIFPMVASLIGCLVVWWFLRNGENKGTYSLMIGLSLVPFINLGIAMSIAAAIADKIFEK